MLILVIARLIEISGYSMTLFQALATRAGYDPVRGVGSSCNDANASGQCVLPWGSGTKAVSSIVLVANGVSFAVRHSSTREKESVLRSLADHDSNIHDYRFRCGLWVIWPLAVPRTDCHLLGSSVCKHVFDLFVFLISPTERVSIDMMS